MCTTFVTLPTDSLDPKKYKFNNNSTFQVKNGKNKILQVKKINNCAASTVKKQSMWRSTGHMVNDRKQRV